MTDYDVLYAHNPGRGYRNINPDRTHYDDPIDTSDGHVFGNSRKWGDASLEVQKQVIDSIIDKSSRHGLSLRETAHVLAIAYQESGFNPDAAAGTTTASGLGQFIDLTGRGYGLDDTNRFNIEANAEALVEHFIDNRGLARERGHGEEFIYKYHHDGPTRDYGGLSLSRSKVVPLIDKFEIALNGNGISHGQEYLKPTLENPIQDTKSKLDVATKASSPIILDLDGNGIETTAVKDGAYFDHAGDGFAEQTGWVGIDDGLLVCDLDGNGLIDTGAELFGSETRLADGSKAANGFEALKALDDNGDGQIDAGDTAFADLRIWIDGDGDGYSQPEELLTLAEASIGTIATAYANSDVIDVQGNAHRQIGTYTRADGSQATAEDVWFAVDRTYSLATTWADVPMEITDLPDLPGYGTVRDLRQALALDTNNGNLKTLVLAYQTQTSEGQRHSLVNDIIYHWTGANTVAPQSRGSYGDIVKSGVWSI